jgi:hypothetical protein
MVNVLNPSELKDIFQEIEGYENKVRKYLAYKQLDIYSGNQDKYILARIQQLYGKDACDQIQAITGMELASRIVDAEASIYKHEPDRNFSKEDGTSVTPDMEEYIEELYECSDEKLKTTNRLFRLGKQCQLMVVPKEGGLKTRVLYNHQYDVVPKADDPDYAEIYIIPLQSSVNDRQDFNNVGDNRNQKIGDVNDADLSRNRYVIWTKEYNFFCNGLGQFLDPVTFLPRPYEPDEVVNPIGMLPFIDVCADKTLGYFAGGGSSLTDFSVAFGVILSDLGEIVKLQGYSQPVISSLEMPKTISVGPHRVLWLKKDKNEPGDKDPKFEFATPSPDLAGSLSFAENVLRMFLTSRGSDNKLITSGQVESYKSGFERLLAMVERSEATVEDKILFERVEEQYFELLKTWNNYLIGTVDGFSSDKVKMMIPDDVEVDVKFHEPMQVMTQEEKENSVQKRLELGLLSRVAAIQELYNVTEEQAMQMIQEIDQPSLSTESTPKAAAEEPAVDPLIQENAD